MKFAQFFKNILRINPRSKLWKEYNLVCWKYVNTTQAFPFLAWTAGNLISASNIQEVSSSISTFFKLKCFLFYFWCVFLLVSLLIEVGYCSSSYLNLTSAKSSPWQVHPHSSFLLNYCFKGNIQNFTGIYTRRTRTIRGFLASLRHFVLFFLLVSTVHISYQ